MEAADNQTPDSGRERDCKRVFTLMEFCFHKKLLKAQLSNFSISPNSSIALKNELSSAGLWPVIFPTRTED